MTSLAWRGYAASRDGKTLLEIPKLRLEGPGIVLLLGPSGGGKSTLLRSATGLLGSIGGAFETGRVEAGGRVGLLPQDAEDAFLSFDVEGEFLLRRRAMGDDQATARTFTANSLQRLALVSSAKLLLEKLSAGERRRVALAAVLSQDPQILLLDEPLNHLDIEWQERFLPIVLAAATTRLVLIATHEPEPWLDAAKRCIVIQDGRVVFDGSSIELRKEAEAFPSLRLLPPASPAKQDSPEGAALVAAEGVRLISGDKILVTDANFRLGPGVHVLQGPNGAGKTTLLRALAGFHPPASGRLTVSGIDAGATDPADLSGTVLLHPEEPHAAFFAETVAEELAFAPRNHGVIECDVTARVRGATFDFELDTLTTRSPFSLSGGERERLALAIAATARPKIFLLDEPTQGLDALGRAGLVAFLRRERRNACIIVATHDDELAMHADSFLRIWNGRLSHDRPEEVSASIPS